MASNGSSAVSLPRPATTSSAPPRKLSFFAKEFKGDRHWVYKFTLKTLLIIGVGLFCVLPFYWGSYYRREDRLHNIRVFVYNQDESLIGNTLVSVLPTNTLGWDVISNNMTVEQITHQIFEEEAWAAIVVTKDATRQLQQALQTADSTFNSTNLIQLIFERERDLTTNPFIQPYFDQVQALFDAQVGDKVIRPLVSNLTDTQKSNVINHAPNVLASSLQFLYVDLSTYEAQILAAVLQIGLLYLIIIAFFQIGFFVELHQRIAVKLNFKSIITYRVLLGFVCYFFISLFTCLVSIAFQVNTRVTFGKPGFLVFWMVTYLTMTAVGMASENMALLMAGTYPPLLGFWLLLWVLINISPAFSSLDLCPPVFKYGYAMPLYNALELNRITLVNTTKRHMGRYFGILIVWIAVNIMFMPFCVKFFQYRMKKNMMKQKQQTPVQREAEKEAEEETELA